MHLTSLDTHRELCEISRGEMDGRNHLLWLYLAAQMLFAPLGMEHSQAVNSGVQCGLLGCWQALGNGILLLQRV